MCAIKYKIILVPVGVEHKRRESHRYLLKIFEYAFILGFEHILTP